ncbi:MAG: right-handed parallel beta-helix repeat-containing protein, partial [Planctomycetota bacterium]|nr:right-handed parallel beta-helix repeat-containing protein [Planctomycetota bacterium]
MNWAGKPYQRSLRTRFSQRQRKGARRRRLVLERLEERTLLTGDLYVTRLTPTGGTAHPFDTLEVQFSQPVVDGTLLLDDVSVNASSVPLAAKGVTKLAADRYQVDLTGLTGLATYSLSLGPNIQGTDGRLMNQDHDATPGEAADAYKAALFSNGVTIASANTTYDGQALVLYGKTSTIDGTHAFSAAEILGGAVVNHTAATTTVEYRLDWTLTDSLWIDGTSSIDVSARGYLPGRTVGNMTTGAATVSSGGSYGGLGAGADGGVTNAVYGDYREPQLPGSGGARGGAGGGAVKVTAATAQIEGAIRADGGGFYSAGGGSGGSLLLHVGTLAGTGSLAANGGVDTFYRGCGGGGRIAIYYDDLSGFDQSKIGALGAIYAGTYGAAGAHGSLYFRQNGAATGELRIDSHGVTTGSYTPLGVPSDTTLTVDTLVVTGVGAVAAPEHNLPLTAGTVWIEKGGNLTHRYASASEAFTLDLTVTGTLTVDATSSIDVSARGYLAGRTVGNTTTGAATVNSGGSYGGLGAGTDGGVTNAAYGDYRDPQLPGSGGARGGAGGGAVKITAATAQIEGAIRANGGGFYSAGGGSGGSLLLHVGTLAGTGSLAANGGVDTFYRGCGGGGRIAIYYDDLSGFDQSKIGALGAIYAGFTAAAGSHGSLYLQKNGAAGGELRIDSHGVTTALYTPLGVGTDSALRVDRLVVTGAGAVAAPEHELPIEAGAVQVLNGGVLTHRAATATNVYTLQLQVGGELTIDAKSRVDVTGRGYLAARTLGNTTGGGASGNSGGSYGGLGQSVDGATNAPYGDPHVPLAPGSGGGRGGAGGGVIFVSAGSVVVDGAIVATGGAGSGTGAGSGGSVLVNTGSLSGSGTIAANGGADTYYKGGGGGGRVAVYYWGTDSFPSANATARGGAGGSGTGQNGSVVLSHTPYLAWTDRGAWLHGTAGLSWLALGLDPTALTVAVTAYDASGAATVLTVGAAPNGTANWNTTGVADGRYELRAVFRDAAGGIRGEITREVTVLNTPPWHSGRITADETWTAGQVHIVEGTFTIGAGVRLTIAPGTVVKFTPGSRLLVENGATVDAPATPAAPIVMTSLADDTAGGDTNLDRDLTRPLPGDWNGFSVVQGGTLNLVAAVDVRYMQLTHTGTLGGAEVWSGTFLHRVTGDVTVPTGATLTIQPGAVVKFDAGIGLTVQEGGTLAANGLLALPIIFTSVKDDAFSGDTNRDGNATVPAAGDWRSLRVESGATARLDHVEVWYGGNSVINQYGAGGMVENGGGTLTIQNSRISESLKDGVLGGGTTSVANSLVTATDRGLIAFGTLTVLNCTVDDNRQGVLEHGGTLTVRNSIVTNNSQAGVIHDWGTERITVSYSDVWNPAAGASNYSGTSNKTGQNGNLSTDPKYKNRDQSDYRLAYRSPAIDAADGAVAPATDLTGAPRYDDPRTPNTGVALPAGTAFPDLGAYEFVETAASTIDLVAASVVGPAQAMVGQQVTVQWTVVNRGTSELRGPWHDAITLLRNPATPSEAVAVAEVLVGAGVVLGPGQSYAASAQVTVPGTVAGEQFWRVTTNSQGDLYEGANSSNNATLSAAQVTLDLPALPIGGAAVAGTFAGTGDARWYKLVPQAGQDLRLVLDAAAPTGSIELFVGQGYMPTPEQFDWQQTEWNSPDVSLVIPSTSTQLYYVLARAKSLPGGALTFALTTSAMDFSLSVVSPATVGNTGPVTLTIQGGKLTEDATYELIDPDGRAVAASAVFSTDSATAYATFNLVGHPTGAYDVRVGGSGSPKVLADAVNVIVGSPGQVESHLSTPSAVRAGRYGELVIEYTNVGNTDVAAPLLMVSVDNGGIVTESGEQQKVFLLGIANSGPAGVLAPGAHGTATYSATYKTGGSAIPPGAMVPPSFRYHAPTVASRTQVAVSIADPAAPIDWASVQDAMRPLTIPADAWPAIFANFTAVVGSTAGQVGSVLAQDATYLSRFGKYTNDLAELTNFELSKNGMDTIAARYTRGAFGRSLPAFWEISAIRDPRNGRVTIQYPNGLRTFVWNAATQQLIPLPGDTGTLTLQDQSYRLVETTGEVLMFRPDGKLEYQELLSGLRMTLSYTGDLVTSITDFQGNVTHVQYN